MDKGDSSPFVEIGVNPVGEFVTDNSFVGVENKAMGFVKEEVIGIEVELGRDFCLDGFIELCVKCPVRKLVLTSCICRKGFNYGVINPDHPPRMLVRSRCGGGEDSIAARHREDQRALPWESHRWTGSAGLC